MNCLDGWETLGFPSFRAVMEAELFMRNTVFVTKDKSMITI